MCKLVENKFQLIFTCNSQYFDFFFKIKWPINKNLQKCYKIQIKLNPQIYILQGLNCIWIFHFQNLITIHLLWSYNIRIFYLYFWTGEDQCWDFLLWDLQWEDSRSVGLLQGKRRKETYGQLFFITLYTFFPLNKPIRILAHLSRMLTSAVLI